jgi:hypothetical protein
MFRSTSCGVLQPTEAAVKRAPDLSLIGVAAGSSPPQVTLTPRLRRHILGALPKSLHQFLYFKPRWRPVIGLAHVALQLTRRNCSNRPCYRQPVDPGLQATPSGLSPFCAHHAAVASAPALFREFICNQI